MFSVDFGGSIGKQEVRVCDTALADSHGSGVTQRVLHFDSPGSSSRGRLRTVPGEGSSQSPLAVPTLPPLHPKAPLLSDSD